MTEDPLNSVPLTTVRPIIGQVEGARYLAGLRTGNKVSAEHIRRPKSTLGCIMAQGSGSESRPLYRIGMNLRGESQVR